MHTRTAFACFGLILATMTMLGAHAQEAEPEEKETSVRTVHFAPTMKKGDVVRFESVKSRTESRDGKVTTRVQSNWISTVTAVNVTDDEITIAWSTGKVSFTPEIQLTPEMQALINAKVDVPVEFVIDGDGMLLRINNIDFVESELKRSLEIATAIMRDKGVSDESIQRTMELMQSTFADREKSQLLILQDVVSYFGGYGFALSPDVRQEFQGTLPNYFGGSPFPSKNVVELVEKEGPDHLHTLRWRSELEPEGTRAAIVEMLRKIAPNDFDESKVPDLAQHGDHTFVYNSRTGWFDRVTITSEVRAEGIVREESLSWEMIKPDEEKSAP